MGCFVVLCFAGAKIYSERDGNDESYEEMEKKMDKIYNENGIFSYTSDGFYIKQKKSMDFVKWDEIEKINSIHINVLEQWQSGLEVIIGTKNYELNDYNSPGIVKFSQKINENLPVEDVSWTIFDIHHPQRFLENGFQKITIYQ